MGKKLTHEEFLKKLLISNKGYRDNTFKILELYQGQSKKILVKHRYGNCKIQCQKLLNGAQPSTENAINPTEFFKNKLRDYNEHFKNEEFFIVGVYESSNKHLIVENKYGQCSVKPSILLKGYNLSIRSAINPHNYFCNMLLDKNPYYRDGTLRIKSTFINDSVKIIVETKYGEHLVAPYSLFHGNLPSIKTSLNKNKQIKKQFKEVHKELYDYSKVEFISHKKLVVIGCKEHGEFGQTPDHHLRGYGCNICANEKRGYKLSQWLNACYGEKGKFYILKCWDEKEEFIKIGITCNTVQYRYQPTGAMPYKYEILTIVEERNRISIWNLEKDLKRELRKQRYKPNIDFAGSKTEVFMLNNIVLDIIYEKIDSFSRN